MLAPAAALCLECPEEPTESMLEGAKLAVDNVLDGHAPTRRERPLAHEEGWWYSCARSLQFIASAAVTRYSSGDVAVKPSKAA